MLLKKLMSGHNDSRQINKIRNEKGNLTTETVENPKKLSDATTKPYTQGNWKSGWNGQFS